MHCNEEDKQSIKENHRQRYRTLLSATTSTLHTSTRTTTTQEEIIPFNMDEQNTGAETTPNYFIQDNLQTGRATIFPISHYKETSRTTTTNRIKRAHTANKTLYTSTLHTSLVPYHTGENRRTDTRKQMKPPLCWNLDFRLEITRRPCFSHAPIFLK